MWYTIPHMWFHTVPHLWYSILQMWYSIGALTMIFGNHISRLNFKKILLDGKSRIYFWILGIVFVVKIKRKKFLVYHICGILYHICGNSIPHMWYTIPHLWYSIPHMWFPQDSLLRFCICLPWRWRQKPRVVKWLGNSSFGVIHASTHLSLLRKMQIYFLTFWW